MPLADCPYVPVSVGGDIYEVASQQFVYTAPYNEKLVADGNELYITILVLAGSSGAVQRSLNMHVDADDGASIDWELHSFLRIQGNTYGVLSKLRDVFESASYHVPTGEFVEVKLQHGKMTYCFRDNVLTEDSEPYLVQITT